jgi:hypothetical protein
MDDSVTTSLSFVATVMRGIAEAGGENSDIQYVERAWLEEIGKRAAEAGIKRRRVFPSWEVEPIRAIEVGIQSGHYVLDREYSRARRMKYSEPEGRKRVFVIPGDPDGIEPNYEKFLKEYGFKPCENAPDYFMGLMATVRESDMPKELHNINIVAVEALNTIATFNNVLGRSCFLIAYRRDGERIIGVVSPYEFVAGRRLGYLAEKI